MDQTTYLFIDGNYLRKRNDEAMQRVFGVRGILAFEKIAEAAGAFRTYFYDCEEIRGPNESSGDFEARVEPQREQFAKIRSLRGFHLRSGTMRSGKSREQKEVDVLLAVDMLTHGFNRNMTRAVLITGDLDFRPVVEALVRMGIFVEVWYEKNSTAQDLPYAADHGHALSWHLFYRWNTEAFRSAHPEPMRVQGSPVPGNANVRRRGVYNGGLVPIIEVHGKPSFALCVDFPYGSVRFLHDDPKVLDGYFTELHGIIQWSSEFS